MDITPLLNGVPLKRIATAFQELSDAYRSRIGFTIDSEEKALAYLIYRSPATMGVLQKVLREISGEVKTVCDCGAGAGTSAWPLHDFFPIEQITFVEENPILISLGQNLSEFHDHVWKRGDLRTFSFHEHDMFLFSYSLNELKAGDAHLVLKKAFQKTKKYLVVVEPGTPEGYRRILGYRDVLVESGGSIIAPCPHMRECPLKEGDWCHFSARIERSKEHRYLKGGSLGYEDEKYAYLVVSKEARSSNGERILAEPRKEKHGFYFKVCGYSGLETRLVPKRQKNTYNSIKKHSWGDIFPCGIIDPNDRGES